MGPRPTDRLRAVMQPVIAILIALIILGGTAAYLVSSRRRKEGIELEAVRQSTLAPGAPTVPDDVKRAIEEAKRPAPDADTAPAPEVEVPPEPVAVEPAKRPSF